MAQVKIKSEIEKVKMACRITDAIFTKICARQDLTQMTEMELGDFILKEIKKRKLRPSFPPIVTSGPRAGNDIHPKPSDKKLQGFVIIDFGVRYEGYCSDITRTIFIVQRKNGKIFKPTKDQKVMYTQVLRSYKMSMKMVKEGVRCADLDIKARKVLGKYQKYFIHMLGHGVGKRIHEEPKIFCKLEKPVLEAGMIITIEPGIYIKNKLGIRIEDTILVTKHGFESLTKSPTKLLVI